VVASSRSVFCTMGLLAILLYVFAIAMRQLTDGTDVGELHFYSVPSSMYRLLIEGVFLDNLSSTVKVMSDSSPVFTIVFLVFVCIAALMVMNMLIGVLCEVVSDVAKREKEDMGVHALKMKLAAVMARLDRDGTGTLSEDEFVQIMGDATIVQLLDEVGVDPIGLIDMASTIFLRDDCDDEEIEITFQEFLEIVLEARGSTVACVKDIRDVKQAIMAELEDLKVKLRVTRCRSFLHGPGPSQTPLLEPRWACSPRLARSPSLRDASNGIARQASTQSRTSLYTAVHSVHDLPDLLPEQPVQRPPSPSLAAPSDQPAAGICGRDGADRIDMGEVAELLQALQAALLRVVRRPAGWALPRQTTRGSPGRRD